MGTVSCSSAVMPQSFEPPPPPLAPGVRLFISLPDFVFGLERHVIEYSPTYLCPVVSLNDSAMLGGTTRRLVAGDLDTMTFVFVISFKCQHCMDKVQPYSSLQGGFYSSDIVVGACERTRATGSGRPLAFPVSSVVIVTPIGCSLALARQLGRRAARI